MVFTASLLGAQHKRNSVENKSASLLVVSLGKALNGMPPSLCGRQMVGPSSLPVVVAQSDERHANRAWAHTREWMNHQMTYFCNSKTKSVAPPIPKFDFRFPCLFERTVRNCEIIESLWVRQVLIQSTMVGIRGMEAMSQFILAFCDYS